MTGYLFVPAPASSRWTTAWRGAVIAEILLAPIAQPNPQDLGDLFLLRFGQPLIKTDSTSPLKAAGPVAMSVPMGTGEADATGRLLDE